MSNPIEFYFDFSSPYGYLGAQRINAIAEKHGRDVIWHPIVLGFIFKVTQSRPLVEQPLKGDYARMDMARSAREHGIELSMPTEFPIATVAAARAVLWVQSRESGQDHSQSTALIQALYKAYFVDNINISDTGNVLEVAAGTGLEHSELATALQDDEVKALLKHAMNDAIEKKVFGSPFMIVDGEPFWGSDRLEQLDRWLAAGGW